MRFHEYLKRACKCWESPPLDELAESQNVKPMADVQALFGTWPGEEDDGFEEAIDELRHPSPAED